MSLISAEKALGGVVQAQKPVQKMHWGGAKNAPGGVQKMHPNKEIITRERKPEISERCSQSDKLPILSAI
jgi:hypothetical protein